jgi:hypothetical protein
MELIQFDQEKGINPMMEKRYTTIEASLFLKNLDVNLTPASLLTLRNRGRGPGFVKLPNGRILYPESALFKFARGTIHHTKDSIAQG